MTAIKKLLFMGLFSFPAIACGLLFNAELTPTPVVTPDAQTQVEPASSAPTTAQPPATITLPISVYIVDDETETFSSERSVEEVKEIYEKVNNIWSQAEIVFVVENIERVTFPAAVLHAIAIGDFGPFFQGFGHTLQLSNRSIINAFYVRSIGGPNGIAPFGARLFFVMDSPSVHDERVTSHEIGHILGLHHTLDDAGYLLYPGTNGMLLTEEEIVVARYNARALLDEGH